jgi:hypothetical protein
MGMRKPPGPTKNQMQAEAMQLELLKKQLAASEKPMEMPQFATPKPAPPPPPPASVTSGTSADVVEQQRDQRRQASRRVNPGRNTIFAGESGTQTTGQPSTLLG